MDIRTAYLMGLAYSLGSVYAKAIGLALDRKPKIVTETIDGKEYRGYWKTLRLGSNHVFFSSENETNGMIISGLKASPEAPKTLKQAVEDFKKDVDVRKKKKNQLPSVPLTDAELEVHKRFTKEFSREARSALRHYSAETKFGLDRQINDKERIGAPLSKVARRVDRGLQQAFKEANVIEDNDFVLYRGVSLDVVSPLLGENPVAYEDKGYSSTSTSLESAMQYADPKGGKTKYILVITPRKGMKAISLNGLSRTASDHEILLDKGIKLERYDLDRKGDTVFVFLR